MSKGPRRFTVASALAIALIALLVLSPAASLLTAISGTSEGLPTLGSFDAGGSALAQMVPGPAGTAYVANEGSTTISVIDTATSTIIQTICLGSDVIDDLAGTPGNALRVNGSPCDGEADHLRPFYDGHLGTHGLWLTPDGRILLGTNRISGTVVAIDTATNTILGYEPVGREPHLATVRPGGHEAWVAIRGEDYIDVLRLNREHLLDPTRRSTERLESKSFIPTALGPSMVSFTSDGRFAFIAAGKSNRVDKLDAETHQVLASQTVSALFTPFGLVSPDNAELYLIHKGAGAMSVLRTSDLGFVARDVAIGGCANHVAFLGKLAYITIGGSGACAPPGSNRPGGKVVIYDRTTHTVVRELTSPFLNGDPHGIWATPDGQRLFVGRESGDAVTVIDTGTSRDDPTDDVVLGTVTGAPQDLKFLKQPIDVVVMPAAGTVGAAGGLGKGTGRDR